MFCEKCGNNNDDNARFCAVCGNVMEPQAPVQQAAPVAAGWTCACGQTGNTGKFCGNCGQPQPAPAAAGWTCSCGATGNTGKFCGECGKPQQQ